MGEMESTSGIDERALREGLGGSDRPEAPEGFAAGLAEAAAREDLLDVAYCTEPSPWGDLLLAATTSGLVTVGFPNRPFDGPLERLSREVSPRVLEAPARLDEVRRQLDEYFDGARREFELALDWRLTRGFVRKVLETTDAIPYGETRSYAEVAAAAGSPRAHRAAGSALGANPIPIVVPCHRVLRTGGALGGYGGGLPTKEGLLRLEGSLP